MCCSLFHRCWTLVGLFALGVLTGVPSALADSYTVADTSGGTWNTIYGQGFNTSLIGPNGTSPSGLNSGDPVSLTQFQFYKSGTADSASNIQLAIFNTIYPNTVGLSTSTSGYIGLSTNTIASTSSLNTGDPITFTFNNLGLTYGSDYGAILVNVSGSSLTPVLVSGLTANYVDQGGGDYHPVPNYGTDSQYAYTTSNYINSGYFSAFSYAGDANFTATLSYTAAPEPCSLALAVGCFGLLTLGWRRRA
ncbi:MAG TPA: hypothetical protein VMJ32_14150 [Pirellulales bacterium]|nr:hypothetical protein [Pirellulales bacterium]